MNGGPERLSLRRPDDWHLHLRDGPMLQAVVPYTARVFGRAIVMPNLVPPVTTAAAARAYRERILAAVPAGCRFTPLMTCYLTDRTDVEDLAAGFAEATWVAAKLYPAGATTNSAAGVTDVSALDAALARMAEMGMPLLVHGEVTDRSIDVFDREAVFLERVLAPIVRRVPGLKVVVEHATTEEAVRFVEEGPDTVAATITAHHLLLNRNALFEGGLRPHHYCLPVLKRERHRLALRRVATSGSPKFFLGTDSAPHRTGDKECACGCAGVFSAPAALELYAEVFAEENALDRLEAFASLNGPRFYGLPANQDKVTLCRREAVVPSSIPLADGSTVTPFRGGGSVFWSLDRG